MNNGDEGGPVVWLVPTPIGNLGDITLRALEVLRGADAVAAEDTRRSRILLDHFGIAKPLVRLDAHTIRERAAGVLERYPRLAYVTDAGSPGLSDPGSELAEVAREAGGRAEALPGATALVPALVLSGLPAGRFTFHGFLPRGGRERRERIQEIAGSGVTNVVYESPYRLGATLRHLAAACGEDRPCAVARELTKMHEEVFRGSLSDASAHYAGGTRGEVVIVVAPRTAAGAEAIAPRTDGRDPTTGAADEDHAAEAARMARSGEGTRAIREELTRRGLDRNRAYSLALQAAREAAGSGEEG